MAAVVAFVSGGILSNCAFFGAGQIIPAGSKSRNIARLASGAAGICVVVGGCQVLGSVAAIQGAIASVMPYSALIGHQSSKGTESSFRAALISGVLVGAGTATAVAVQAAASPLLCLGVGAAVAFGLGRLVVSAIK